MCVGVSHLVQSTRAGADYGFLLLGAVLAANFFKYPFFEFSARYTNATGKSLISSYHQQGRWILVLFAISTFFSMFIVTAAVSAVTGGIMAALFGSSHSGWFTAGALLLSCLLLVSGRYSLLDGVLKLVSIVLLISTVVAVIAAATGQPAPQLAGFERPDIFAPAGILFLIALMGWMPTAVDMSVWTGLWAEERSQQTNYQPNLRESLFDFNLGYLLTAVLAVIFLSLGALIFYGTGTDLANSSAAFASQLIGMYTTAIGSWSFYIIATAVFCTMFSTTITVLDGYGRTMQRIMRLLVPGQKQLGYRFWLVVAAAGALLIILQYLNQLKALVDFATSLSFLIAPFAAWLNFRAVLSPEVAASHRPPTWLRALAWAGLLFLTAFALLYVWLLLT